MQAQDPHILRLKWLFRVWWWWWSSSGLQQTERRMSSCGLTRELTGCANPGTHTHARTTSPSVLCHGIGSHARHVHARLSASWTVNGVYLGLAGCTHRSPVQDHGHLGGLVDVAAERSAGPGAGVAGGLPASASTPQACRHKDGELAHCLPPATEFQKKKPKTKERH